MAVLKRCCGAQRSTISCTSHAGTSMVIINATTVVVITWWSGSGGIQAWGQMIITFCIVHRDQLHAQYLVTSMGEFNLHCECLSQYFHTKHGLCWLVFLWTVCQFSLYMLIPVSVFWLYHQPWCYEKMMTMKRFRWAFVKVRYCKGPKGPGRKGPP